MKTMKRILSVLIFVAVATVSSYAQNDAINRFFESYQDNEEFSSVYVSPRMFQMVAKVAGEEMEGDLADVVKDLQGLQVLMTEVEPMKYYQEAVKKIPLGEYELLVKVRDEGQNVRIFSKSSGDVINELVLMVGGADEFVLMSFVGKIDINKLSKLATTLDIDGAESLELLSK